MQADRELLELAAKAAGIEYTISFHGNLLAHKHPTGGEMCFWNPLTDDGDRYRLAQRLGISIDYEDCCAWTRKHGDLIQEFWGGECPDEAHVIVGVAAEIGRKMR